MKEERGPGTGGRGLVETAMQRVRSSHSKAFLFTAVAVFALIVVSAVVVAQPATRRATNLAALHAYPGFYHGRPIVVVGKVALEQNGQLRVSDDVVSVHLVFKGNAPDGLDEVRGEFWDIGRMKLDDLRLSTYDLRTTFKVVDRKSVV